MATPDLSYSDEPYVVITADTHAGANLATYREYLDPKLRDDFDAWRGSYKNPSKEHIGRKKTKNWDSAERFADLEKDGIVAEVVFPNTVPPFYPKAFHICAPPTPEQYELYRAGVQAHNRWLVDFCAEAPERRAGIGLIHLNSIDDAIEDVKWIAEQGLRGGVLLPQPPDDMKHIPPLYAPKYDRLWAAIQDLDLPMNQHSGVGAPDYGPYAAAHPMWIQEVGFFSQRGLKSLIWGGAFQRFPKLRFTITEAGCHWVPELVQQMDRIHAGIRAGMMGEMDYKDVEPLPEPPSFYAKRNCYYGTSFPGKAEIEGRYEVGTDKVMWGSDYPHYEGSFPYSRQAMQLAHEGLPEEEVRGLLGGNAAKFYDFDLEKLKPHALRAAVMPKDVAVPLDEIPEGVTSPSLQRALQQKKARRAQRKQSRAG
jgi:predicted TIM-barrel fold metal-dependent hydrolase